MKKYFSEAIEVDGTSTLLHVVEMPPDGKLNMPLNALGYYEGEDVKLYYPVNPLNKTFMDADTLCLLTWHGIRNLQRKLTVEENAQVISKTRRLHQLHEMLLGDNAYDEKVVEDLYQKGGLDLLLEICKEIQYPYQAVTNDTIIIEGVPVDRRDLLLALQEAADWFLWESDQPDQKNIQGWLLRNAVIALCAVNDLQDVSKEESARMIAERINIGHSDDPIPVEQVLEVMAYQEISTNSESRRFIGSGYLPRISGTRSRLS